MNQNVTDFGMIKTALKEKARQMVFAQIVGISQPAVSEHLNNGILTDGESYEVWIKQYCAHMRTAAAGRAENNDELRAATIREKIAKARQAEVNTAKELAQLVRIDSIKDKLAMLLSHMSSVLLNCESTIREHAKLELGVDIPTGFITNHHKAALSELANFVRPVDAVE